MSIPDITQRFPEGMREIPEIHERTNLLFGDMLDDMIKDSKTGDYYYCKVIVILNGQWKCHYETLEEVKRIYKHYLDVCVYKAQWHDETILFEI